MQGTSQKCKRTAPRRTVAHSTQTELNPADQISIPRHNCCSPRDECYRKSRECEGLQNVLMDAVRKRTGMCCIQWKDDEFVNQMPRTSYQSGIDETADKSSQEEILTVL